jgi:hypothetical protein
MLRHPRPGSSDLPEIPNVRPIDGSERPSIERLNLESTFPTASPAPDLEFPISPSLHHNFGTLVSRSRCMDEYDRDGVRKRGLVLNLPGDAEDPTIQFPTATYADIGPSPCSPNSGTCRPSPSLQAEGAHRNITNTQPVRGAARQTPAMSP